MIVAETTGVEDMEIGNELRMFTRDEVRELVAEGVSSDNFFTDDPYVVADQIIAQWEKEHPVVA